MPQSEPYNGLILVDKPQGCTSHDVVDRLRDILHMRTIGHSGTLDPMASGLMVMLVGEATKLSNYILEKDKSYKLRAQLGLITDTLDATGQVLEQKPVTLSQAQILNEVLQLQGDLTLPVPLFSAIKKEGQKLYEYARRGQDVDLPMKEMLFTDFKVVEQGPDWIELEMRCSKGSYVRSWVQALGQRLGCGAVLSSLVRTGSQPYSLQQAHTLDQIAALVAAGATHDVLIPMRLALPEYKAVRVGGFDETLFCNGQISHGVRSQLISLFNPGKDPGVKIVSQKEGLLLGLVALEAQKGFVIRRVFRNP